VIELALLAQPAIPMIANRDVTNLVAQNDVYDRCSRVVSRLSNLRPLGSDAPRKWPHAQSCYHFMEVIALMSK
jgi:hypothetical protein